MTKMPHIVLVEDDEKLSALLTEYLSGSGFDVTPVYDGAKAVAVILEQGPELVILDLMLPGLDGLQICGQVRHQYSGQILMLTASDDDFDHVSALEVGADDFVSKPVKPRVLMARIRNLLRRQVRAEEVAPSTQTEKVVNSDRRFGGLYLNQIQRMCTLAEVNVKLTDAEFDLLWIFACNPDQILSRSFLVSETRGIEYDGLDRTVDNKIAILRKKLGDDPSNAFKLITVRGKGYVFVSKQW
ncbi:response regulator [Vibrio sp. Of7-15]|uniref:response regulator n=1 Tax=Vibrio sp. Of7-15 TaxID=2724879 RepID=UPI001EF21775|nr:response regulator [Vibrio sp. Of7-15]MCG7499195.1 response regulator [Vibrio sp. Of7-15]